MLPSDGELLAKAGRLLGSRNLSQPNRETLEDILEHGLPREHEGYSEEDLRDDRHAVRQILQYHGRLY